MVIVLCWNFVRDLFKFMEQQKYSEHAFHTHIKEWIEDFGPVYLFWCFSFERLNEILGSYHTNNHHISVQLMRGFLESYMLQIIGHLILLKSI